MFNKMNTIFSDDLTFYGILFICVSIYFVNNGKVSNDIWQSKPIMKYLNNTRLVKLKEMLCRAFQIEFG